MPNYGEGGGWSGPDRQYRGTAPFSPLEAAYESARAARSTGEEPQISGGGRAMQINDPGAEEEAFWSREAAHNPDIRGPGESRLDADATPEAAARFATQPSSFMVGGRPYQRDPRIGLGLELARAQQARGVQNVADVDHAQLAQREQESRVARLVSAGYSQKEAVRQVFGGPRTVSEEQELVNTRSQDQLAKDKAMQGEIGQRQQAAQAARANLQMTLQRARSGDRSAALDLRRQQILLQDATRAHSAAVKARQQNALGGIDMGDPTMDPADAALHAAVDQQMNDVQSTEAARVAAVAGVKRAGNTGAAGADNISDRDAAAFLGVRQPGALDDASGGTVHVDPMAKYHKAFQRGVLPGQTAPGAGLPPAPKPLEDHMHGPAAADPGYAAWLAGKGYAVPAAKKPEDEQQDDESFDAGDGGAIY